MIDVTGLPFGAASLVLIATPSQAMIRAMSRAIAQEAAGGVAHPTAGVFILGLAHASLTFLIQEPIGLAVGYLSAWLRGNPKCLANLDRTSGGDQTGGIIGGRKASGRGPASQPHPG